MPVVNESEMLQIKRIFQERHAGSQAHAMHARVLNMSPVAAPLGKEGSILRAGV